MIDYKSNLLTFVKNTLSFSFPSMFLIFYWVLSPKFYKTQYNFYRLRKEFIQISLLKLFEWSSKVFQSFLNPITTESFALL